MNNLHTPERLQDESFDDYRKRRAASHRAARVVERGAVAIGEFVLHRASVDKRSRKAAIRLDGGIRQFKRKNYVLQHEGYADKHPAIAVRCGIR